MRILISGADSEAALGVTKSVYEELGALRAERKDDFLFFGCMKAPLKKLQGKFRYQVLMRITSGKDELKDRIFAVSDKYNSRTVSVYMEINPNNLT